jgi:RimJ/RimL family protein N-acetyltransferase
MGRRSAGWTGYKEEIVLRDGTTAQIRPARPKDRAQIEAFYAGLSDQSLYLRFHRRLDELPADQIQDEVEPDFVDKFTLVAIHEGRIIAVGTCERLSGQAEKAGLSFTVEDSHQGQGVATHLLNGLAAIARDNGIERFEADVLAENQPMIDVLHESGYPLQSTLKFGVMHVTFPISGDQP